MGDDKLNVKTLKPLVFARVSNISGTVRGVFEADANGKAPDVELKTETLLCLNENVKTLGPNSGYSVLRIDPSKDTRGPKMLFKPFEPFVKNDYHGIDFIMCSVINERNNFNPDAFSGEIESNQPLTNENEKLFITSE